MAKCINCKNKKLINNKYICLSYGKKINFN